MTLRIIIIGGGIGGLAAYRAFQKYLTSTSSSDSSSPPAVTVRLYEAYPTPSSTTQLIGGGLGLAPNGMHALSIIHPPAASYIMERGYACQQFMLWTDKGKSMGALPFRQKQGGQFMTMAARATVHESLLVELGENVPGECEVHWGKRVSSIYDGENEVKVSFEDGTEETCDLLIGADGVRSIARQAIFGKDAYQPKYEYVTRKNRFPLC
jgi:2-polyprenyl-6-methoxyphenol hydroxylase-like FAD-dependent oxidoreductase